MTLQESFERCNFVEFVYADSIVILYFQNEAIRHEFHEELKTRSKETPLTLEIETINDNYVHLSLVNEDDEQLYTSSEVRYRGRDVLNKLKENNLSDSQIKLYTDILQFIEGGGVIPGSDSWIPQQSDPNKVILTGYKILN